MAGGVMNIDRHPNLQRNSGRATFGGGIGGLCMCGTLFLPLVAFAQSLPDPTRPPAGFIDPADVRAGAIGGSGAPLVPAAGSAEAAPKWELQSVMLPKKGKPVAVISGKYLPLGSQVDGWVLSAIGENEAVLSQGKGRQVLRLTPQVSKTPVVAKAPVPAAKLADPKKTKKAKAKESELK